MRHDNLFKLATAIALSIIFTGGLFYTTFELPYILDKLLHNYFPDVFWQPGLREQMIETIRPYGYLSLTITLALILIGFITRKGYLSILGSVSLYLPIFGYFAYTMFFLAGLGILRVLWLPLSELSPIILNLGYIVYLPFLPLLASQNLSSMMPLIAFAVMWIGLLTFSFGVITWLYGKFKGCKVIDFWIYRYSRHPQYLGFLLWSYGLLLFVGFKPYIRGAFATPPTFIWLVSSMIVIGVALYEEMEMKKKYGKEYEHYCKRTPFMLPLPGTLSKFIVLPLRSLMRWPPKSEKDIVAALITYLVIFIVLSYLLLLILEA